MLILTGANLLLLARSENALRHTQGEVQRACTNTKQIIDAIPVDLTKPDEVRLHER